MPRSSKAPKTAKTAPSGGSRAALNPQAMASMLAMLRLFLGVKFLLAGWEKIGWPQTHTLATLLMKWTSGEHPAALPWFLPFLKHTILPHASLFTWLVVVGEIGVGLLLLLGLCTRLAALLAIVMNVSYLLANWNLGPASQGINEAFIVMALACLVVGAGRVYGLDTRLAQSPPRWLLW